MQMLRVVALGLCAVALPGLPLPAQSPPATALLAGQVMDQAGAAIVGARVSAEPLDGSGAVRAVSDAQGRFSFADLRPGTYTLHVEHAGFREIIQRVQAGSLQTGPLTLRMTVASLAQSVTVSAQPALITESPLAQTQSVVSREDFKNSPALTIGEVLALMPGVTFIQGNGPRDVSISVRGSNERQTFGIRNLQVFEDGFPVTQPDGLARTDLTDPHAYSSIDVVRGPSSALYGNYATGGALNFHTRTGSEIGGLDAGADFGSFGYFNDFISYGRGNERYEVAAFLSNVRADQATAHNSFNTITGTLLASFAATPKDRFTFKFIANELDTDLSIRLSLAQYQLNPLQQGCSAYSTAASGCASVSLFANGYNGARQSLTAEEAGLGRHDHRTIVGARYEHDLTDGLTWRTQFVFDDRDINQPTSSSSFRGPYPSFNVVSDVLRRGTLWGKRSTTFAGGSFNDENISSYVFNVAPGGHATLGGQTQTVFGSHLNTGGRVRQELALGERWVLVAGLGMEFTALHATANNFTYPTGATPVISPVLADRTFFNAAPEVAVQFHASDALRLHGRLGTGYGTPQATQLFTNAQGAFGNNTTLQTQRNTGIDGGVEWTPGTSLQASVTAFYEWFRNEQVTQSAGVNLQSFTFNAPASAHRGLEAGLDWRPIATMIPGLRLRSSYLLDKQVYTSYSETLTTGSQSASFSRSGLSIPGVIPNSLNGRLMYDQPSGRIRGLGGYLEVNWRDKYRLDNANFLSAPGYTLLNLSTHYDPPAGHAVLSRLRFYFDVQNLANKTFVASAANLTNSLNAATGAQNGADVLATVTGSIYAGAPRASYGGVRVRF